MTSGKPRTRRDQYRVWKRIAAGVKSTRDLADQLGLTEQTVSEIKCDACVILWQHLTANARSSLIDELCDRAE